MTVGGWRVDATVIDRRYSRKGAPSANGIDTTQNDDLGGVAVVRAGIYRFNAVRRSSLLMYRIFSTSA
jgi:hypothetical protein